VTSPAERLHESIRTPIFWGVIFGIINFAAPPLFWWLDLSTVHALLITLIAAVYIGFAVGDGRPRILVAELVVASIFFVLAAIAVVETAWLLVVAYAGHGLKDMWQHRTHFVANTRWWPPFCCAVDFVVAAALVVMIAAGVDFH
jgi:hypothetical protein